MLKLFQNCSTRLLLQKQARILQQVHLFKQNFGNSSNSQQPDAERNKYLSSLSQYPKFIESYSLEEYRKKWDSLPSGAREENEEIYVAGRIQNKRKASSKLIFYDIKSDDTTIQILATKGRYEGKKDDSTISFVLPQILCCSLITVHFTSRGLFIDQSSIETWRYCVRGYPGKSDKGELSIIPKELFLLSPCIPPLPREWQTLSNDNIVYRQRYLDLIVNEKSRQTFLTRTKILNYIRSFLNTKGFMEVETPVLSSNAGGANACPFVTKGNRLGEELYMRISPELYLKQLVIGGFGKVYEVSRVFRNEGIDQKHNPEFTTIEAYRQYIDVQTWIQDSQDLLASLCQHIHNSYEITYQGTPLSFKPPYPQLDILTELKKHIPELIDMNDASMLPLLINHCKDHSIKLNPPFTQQRVLDELIHHYIECQCINPTFIVGHPMIMSPLAHESPSRPGIAERFELFVNGMELINAYTEQNSPFVQKEMFELQAAEKKKGDAEIPPTDEDFVTALTYGLPPTSGWGLGVDRLVMMLTDSASIKDVILFPTLRHGVSDTITNGNKKNESS